MNAKIFLFLIVGVMLISLASAVPTNLTGHWKFDEASGNASDSSGKNNNLTTVGSPTYLQGILNNATNVTYTSTWNFFNGSRGNSNWTFGNNNFTVAYWFKVPSGSRMFVHNFPVGSWAATDGWALYVQASGAISVAGNASDKVTTTALGYNDNTWHRVVMTREGLTTDLAKIYVDNINIQNFTFADNLNWSDNLIVGRSGTGEDSTTLIKGVVDDLRIYNGYAWNQSDVAADFNPVFGNVLLNSNIFNRSTYETSLENFFSNLTIPSALSLSSAYLNWNGTSYAATIAGGGTSYTLGRALDIPAFPFTATWFWDLRFSNGTQINLSSSGQTITFTNLTICGAAPQNSPFVNFTFKNETGLMQQVSATIVSTWTYYLGDGDITKSYSFSNASENPSYAFCLSPQNRTLYATPNIQYANSYSTSRNYNPSVLTLTNATTATTLYLLPTLSGQVVTFQIVNSALTGVEGATVSINRTGFGLIESKTTDSSGGAAFFLDPTASYAVCASKSGLGISCVTVTPTESSYTITLGSGSGGTNITDTSRGITYSFGPVSYELTNNTAYTFNFTIGSTYSSLEGFGFVITNSTGGVITSASGSGTTGGTVSVSLNTGTNATFIVNAYWIIDSVYGNATKQYIIINQADTQWSIAHFFSDLSTYLSDPNDPDGLYGLKVDGGYNFNLALLVFFLIFILGGVFSYKYGITSPSSIMIIMSSFVFLFDVGFSLIPRPVSDIPIAFIIMMLVTMGVFFREMGR